MSFIFEDGFVDWTQWQRASSTYAYSFISNGVAGFEASEEVGTHYAYAYHIFASAYSEVYLRGYVQFNYLPPSIGDRILVLGMIGNATGNPLQAEAGVRNVDGQVVWTIQARHGTSLATFNSDVPVQTGKLYLIELRWKKSSSSGSSDGICELFVEGDYTTPVVSFAGFSNFSGGDVFRFAVGMLEAYVQTGTATSFRMDDIAFNNTGPIGAKIVTPATLNIDSVFLKADNTQTAGNVLVEISYDNGTTWTPIGNTPITGYTDPRLLPGTTGILIRVPAETV